jgi:2',3'-cyclic-nucleotide 2'-phosphodiesterase (5'-nucleotidase family)
MRNQDKCDILVLLSHTGVNKGDRELAQLGYYDLIFSGNEQFFDFDQTMRRYPA